MTNTMISLIKKLPFFTPVKFFIYRLVRPKFWYFLSGTAKPISNVYGIDRGKPIDRFYIETFLKKNASHIHGTCLELLNNHYARTYGADKVSKSDVLDINSDNKNANIFGDLKNLHGTIPDNTYDCIILTQVLQFIDDYDAALLECKRILKPGGHILITAPAMSRIDCASGIEGDFWRFTEASFNYILKKIFSDFTVESVGNAKTGAGFWIGLSQQDIGIASYCENDKNFPVIIAAIVTK